jgi:hypothetical protein
VLAPFVDADCGYPRDTELNRVSSIFVPVRDALRRTRMEANQVDAVLLVGGRSLLPQVQKALGAFFPRAELLLLPDGARTLSGVAPLSSGARPLKIARRRFLPRRGRRIGSLLS